MNRFLCYVHSNLQRTAEKHQIFRLVKYSLFFSNSMNGKGGARNSLKVKGNQVNQIIDVKGQYEPEYPVFQMLLVQSNSLRFNPSV